MNDKLNDSEMADESMAAGRSKINVLGNKDPDTDSYRVLGNVDRDMWKRIAFIICDTKKELPAFEKAVLGTLCGHRQAMLNVAGSWEDKVNFY